MNLLTELNELYGDKTHIIVGKDDERYYLLNTQRNTIIVTPKGTITSYASKVCNAVIEKDEVTANDISKTRLNFIAEGGTNHFIYLIKRYRDSKDTTLGYLAYLVKQNNTQLKRVSKDELETFFNTTTVLNAKKVEKDGKTIVSGIMHNIPETYLTTDEKREVKDTNNYKVNYLKKIEKKLINSFLQNGYSTKLGYTKDWQKKIQRYIEEVLKTQNPDIYNWFAKNKNILRAIQAIDAHLATQLVRGTFNGLKVINKTPFTQSVVSKNGYGQFSKDFYNSSTMIIYSPSTSGITTKAITPNHLNRSGKNVITYSREGVINITDTSAIKDTKALLEGQAIGELKIYHLNGVLATELNTLPIPDMAKLFLDTRDHITISPIRLEMVSILENFKNNPTIYKILKACMKKGFVAKDYIIKSFDSDKLEVNTEYKKEFIPQTVDWNSVNAYYAMNIDITGVNNDNLGESLLDTNIFYSKNILKNGVFTYSKKTISKKELDKEFTHARCVGDYILLHQIKHNTKNVSGSQKLTDKDLLKRYALLLLGNKDLAKELYYTDYLPTMLINASDIDDLPSSNSIAYQTGGRLGDKQMVIYYERVIPYKEYTKLALGTIEELREILNKLAPNISYSDYELETIY